MTRDRSIGQRGHAMIELALCSSLMVTCLAGTFHFGYTFYIYDQLVSAVGNGARYAASRTYRAASPGDVEKGAAAIRNLVVYGSALPAPGAAPIVAGLTPENVQVNWIKSGEKDGAGAPSTVDVFIVHYTVGAMFGSFTFDHRPFAEFPYVGRYAPGESEP